MRTLLRLLPPSSTFQRSKTCGSVSLAATCLLLGAAGLSSGCNDSSEEIVPDTFQEGETKAEFHEDLLRSAIDDLNRTEVYDPNEVTYKEGGRLRQIVDRLKSWLPTQHVPENWQPAPLLATLSEPLQKLPIMEDLGELTFYRYDGFTLQEAVLLRDVANWARGPQLDDVSRAKRLFDWTVRNLQLESAPWGGRPPLPPGMTPWQTLLFGRATPIYRAWTFILLARQQKLDVALLAREAEDGSIEPWLLGLASGDDVYLFDPALGIPIPAKNGVRLDDTGRLDIQPATLAEVLANPDILRQLDLSEDDRYPVDLTNPPNIVALVEGSPSYLARRMEFLESQLAGADAMVLSVDAEEQAAHWKSLPTITDARLWDFPYEVIRQQEHLTQGDLQNLTVMLLPFHAATPFEVNASASLWRGRLLHLKGAFLDKQTSRGATYYYQRARPSREQITNLDKIHYRLIVKGFGTITKEQREEAETRALEVAQERATVERPVLLEAKKDASYWLGLIAFERGEAALAAGDPETAKKRFESAIDYFLARTLQATPGGPWTPGATYNLARSYEAIGNYEEAQFFYGSEAIRSPGARLRARWLKELTTTEASSDTEQATPPDPTEPNKPVESPGEVAEPELTAPKPNPEEPLPLAPLDVSMPLDGSDGTDLP